MWYLKRVRKQEFFLSGEFLKTALKSLKIKEIKIEEIFLTVDIFTRDQIYEN